ncbi:epoxide hydrolase, soluble (sEH) [Marasmius tenuissimus]|uniref:Epoxide hydrolase, soluble (SEH) n=1 Tax=Marasmius tenuissimus TaxID=585030 RepID=A0ABR2ZB79_9AGAR
MRFNSKKVKFVAVDEPSSALDPRGEEDLFDHLREAREGKTMLFVTHRFGPITKYADRIICMKKGKLFEHGTHAELMGMQGEYYKMYNIQARAFDDKKDNEREVARIKVWQLDVENGTWNVEDDWKAHDAAVSKVSWAHPEFGPIIASSSFDRTVKIWEQTTVANEHQEVNGTASTQPSSSRWVERAVLLDARGTVRAVEFAPHHFGLKLATISTDNFLRIYECLEQPSLATWQLSEEVDVLSIPSSPSALNSRAHTVALATPTQTHASLDGASASLVAQALLQQQTPLHHGPVWVIEKPTVGGVYHGAKTDTGEKS